MSYRKLFWDLRAENMARENTIPYNKLTSIHVHRDIKLTFYLAYINRHGPTQRAYGVGTTSKFSLN